MSCHTNCAVLNITSCVYNTLARQVMVKQVQYDRDGCFTEAHYLRDGDKYSTFLQVNRQYIFYLYISFFVLSNFSLIQGFDAKKNIQCCIWGFFPLTILHTLNLYFPSSTSYQYSISESSLELFLSI
jgi:hypothetical protein